MNSLELKLMPHGTNVVINQDYPATVTYSLYGKKLTHHDLKFLLKAGNILEIYSSFDHNHEIKEQATPLSLMEQVSKLPFKEQNALYKLMNTWGCRMER